ncbi:MAG: restriction endonuclease subunit S, partial [Actinomycetota bacterium]|nr:restriction endonuclease subunit S [Actinomycetota bacterium]
MARDFRDEGVPLIRLSGLSARSLLKGCNYLDPAMVHRKWKHFRLNLGDTLLSTSASLGRIARVGAEAEGAIPYTGIIRMRPKDARLDGDFIQYLLQGRDFQQQIEAMGAGSVMRHFGPSHLREMVVTLPGPAEQRRITAVLGRLDEKIDSNPGLAQLLEETVATVFRGRFVDFVGVHDVKESDLGPLPISWKVGRLADLASIQMGQSPPGESYTMDPSDSLRLVQGMGDFGERFPDSERFTSAPTKRALAGSTLMTVRAPVGAVNVADTEVCVGRGVAAISSKYGTFTEFLIRSLGGRWASEESGTIFPAVNRKQVLGLPVVV